MTRARCQNAWRMVQQFDLYIQVPRIERKLLARLGAWLINHSKATSMYWKGSYFQIKLIEQIDTNRFGGTGLENLEAQRGGIRPPL